MESFPSPRCCASSLDRPRETQTELTFNEPFDEARVPDDRVVLVLARRFADSDDEIALDFLSHVCLKALFVWEPFSGS